VELQSRYEELRAAGWGLAVITYDSQEILKGFAEKRGIAFPLLSDRGSQVIRAFGLLNGELPPDHRFFGIPHPGTFVCDPQGKVIARYFEDSYRDRVTVGMIAASLGVGDSGTGLGGGLDRPGTEPTRESREPVTITAFASDGVIAPGNRFSLVVEIRPREGFHVYAPGEHDYRPVRLTVEPQLGLQFHPVEYPEAEIYVYEPLDERVPVYSRPFRLVQEVTLPVSRETGELARQPGASLTLTGSLQIQACTADKCYPPREVPLSWKLALRPLQ